MRKAKLVWLRGSITTEQYPAIQFEYDEESRHPRIWRMPCVAYADNPKRTEEEALAIVRAINGVKPVHPQL